MISISHVRDNGDACFNVVENDWMVVVTPEFKVVVYDQNTEPKMLCQLPEGVQRLLGKRTWITHTVQTHLVGEMREKMDEIYSLIQQHSELATQKEMWK